MSPSAATTGVVSASHPRNMSTVARRRLLWSGRPPTEPPSLVSCYCTSLHIGYPLTSVRSIPPPVARSHPKPITCRKNLYVSPIINSLWPLIAPTSPHRTVALPAPPLCRTSQMWDDPPPPVSRCSLSFPRPVSPFLMFLLTDGQL